MVKLLRSEKMIIHYSKDADALYIRLADKRVADTDQLNEDVIIDYDEKGDVIAIEILDASKKTDIARTIIDYFPSCHSN